MITAAGVAVLLGLLIVFLIKSKVLRISGAILCIIFGLVVGSLPVAATVIHVLNVSASWFWTKVTQL